MTWNRIDELLGRRVSLRALALLRIAAGLVTLLHLRPFLEAARDGRIYRDSFYEPYASWYPELPRSVYIALLWFGAAAALAMAAGLMTRVSTALTFGIVTYNLLLSTTHMHNNRAYLVVVLGILALAPCGRECSADAWLRVRRGLPPLDPSAPGWTLWLLRFEASVVYGASGFSKLVDRDWFGGTVTWDRADARARSLGDAHPAAGLGHLGHHEPHVPHLRGQGHRADRAVHRDRAVVPRHALRGRMAGRGVPRVDRGDVVGAGVLVPRHRRARDLGGAVHP